MRTDILEYKLEEPQGIDYQLTRKLISIMIEDEHPRIKQIWALYIDCLAIKKISTITGLKQSSIKKIINAVQYKAQRVLTPLRPNKGEPLILTPQIIKSIKNDRIGTKNFNTCLDNI